MGSFIDIADESGGYEEGGGYRSEEDEANAFASELLLPRDWVAAECGRADNLSNAHRHVADAAETSRYAAMIAMLDAAPRGVLYAQLRDGKVVSARRSPGTLSRPVAYGTTYSDLKRLYGNAFSSISDHGVAHGWVRVIDDVNLPNVDEARPWKEILGQVLAEIEMSQDSRKFSQRLNGIVSGANASQLRNGLLSEADFFSDVIFRLRESDIPDMPAFRDHPLFQVFVLARVRAFIAARHRPT